MSRGLLRLAGVVLAVAFVAYPALVYFLLERNGLLPLSVVLGLLLVLRLIPLLRDKPVRLALALAAVGVFFVAVQFSGTPLLLLLYPTLISLVLLIAFAATLLRPPSMIERISRAAGMDVPPEAVRYMRVLTGIWCVFFVFNATVSAALAWWGDTGLWAIYNGLISYGLIGALIVAELIFRRWFRRRHGLA